MISMLSEKENVSLLARRIFLSITFPFLLSPLFPLFAVSQWISIGHFGFSQEGVQV